VTRFVQPAVFVLLLLTMAATASAECAWVLWAGGIDPPEKAAMDVWRPVKGYAAIESCLQDAAERGDRRYPAGDYIHHQFFMCLPDTVDPRAAKERQ
jgi:hypothetical protein